jgi:signal transduction histidine kinase
MVRGGSPGEPHEQVVRLCHDLRQYLAASINLAEMADHAGPEAGERFRLIADQLRLANELINAELRDARKQMVDLGSLIEECVQTVRLTHETSLAVKAGQSTFAYGDPVRIRQAVANVLDNAARAAGVNGTVDVTVDSHDGLAWIQVSDDGQGFGRMGSGFGQGLPIVHDAVRANGGRLEISSGPGRGTTVRLLWPQQPQK